MKRILYFVFRKSVIFLVPVIFFIGCESKPIVTVVTTNGAQAEWILVSVRDSSIVLLPPYEPVGKGIAFTHCVLIRSRDINRIVLHPKDNMLSRLPLALFGAGTGLLLRSCNCDDRLYHIIIGLVVGYNLSGLSIFLKNLKEQYYFLWLESDRKRLSKEAVYPIEPEIMKYLREP